MLPLRFFRSRAFSAANGVSLLMYVGMFGAIFLLAQFFQIAQGYSPLEAGLRTRLVRPHRNLPDRSGDRRIEA